MMQPTFKTIPIESLERGRYQPRRFFSQIELQELASSIQSQGIIEPLIIRPSTEDHYEIIAGERRWRAAMLAGLKEVPCLITHYSDEQTAAVTLIENVQRSNLNLIEEATGYQRLISEFRFSQDDIATLTGKSRSHIANILRLLTLCPEVQDHIHQSRFSLGHARMLVGLPKQIQCQFSHKIINDEWSVRRLEKEVRALKQVTPSHPSKLNDNDRLHLQLAIGEYLGTPVEICSDTGMLKIKFFDNDTLSGLLERIGMRYD